MSRKLYFLSVEQVFVIHQRMIDEFGGAPDVRDHGLLESAVAMPQAQFSGHYLHSGIPAMAAAYLFHICKNHPFVDGNKRTALATAATFIDLNDYSLNATDDQLEEITLGVADSTFDKDALTAIFKKHVRRRPPAKRK
jgi:death-on-curing protein